MRDKSHGRPCDPKPFVRRQVPVEANPMLVSLRPRRIVNITITEKMKLRHAWYRKQKFWDHFRAMQGAA